MELDDIDAKLLTELQRDNRLSTGVLGEHVGLSATAVQRRIRRMREEGVIDGDVSIVSPKAVGRNILMVVLVQLERERADIIDDFKRSIRTSPEVMNGHYVTGEVDFVLTISARDMEDYEDFTRRFFYANPHVRAFRTLVIMDRIKHGYTVPVTATARS
jgi:Lrp/AsnC family leucine-responsive transcriptional regulator